METHEFNCFHSRWCSSLTFARCQEKLDIRILKKLCEMSRCLSGAASEKDCHLKLRMVDISEILQSNVEDLKC